MLVYSLDIFVYSCILLSWPGETPGHAGWAETPHTERGADVDHTAETPTPHGSKRRSRWDETPASQRLGGAGTPLMGATPTSGTPAMAGTPNFALATPAGALAMQMQTPTPGE